MQVAVYLETVYNTYPTRADLAESHGTQLGWFKGAKFLSSVVFIHFSYKYKSFEIKCRENCKNTRACTFSGKFYVKSELHFFQFSFMDIWISIFLVYMHFS